MSATPNPPSVATLPGEAVAEAASPLPAEPVCTKEIAIVNPDWKTAKIELRYVALVEDDEAVNRLVATLNACPVRATLKADGQPVYVPPFAIKEVPSGS